MAGSDDLCFTSAIDLAKQIRERKVCRSR